MSTWFNLNFQNSNSPLMEQLTFFHDHSMLILILITMLVGYLMVSLLLSKHINNYFLSSLTIEIIWLMLPAIILLFIAFPSLRLLYLLDEINKPLITMKTMGHQWYWKYELTNFNNIEFDSYLLSESDYTPETFRLLETDNSIILPFKTQTRILVTATDVLHAWTIPSLGVKVDATPGRLNQLNFSMNNTGSFFGQCSEICGANHSFMPIKLESSSLKTFLKWTLNF